jgi:hypothetical protein
VSPPRPAMQDSPGIKTPTVRSLSALLPNPPSDRDPHQELLCPYCAPKAKHKLRKSS